MRVELTCDVRPDRDGQTPADSWPLPHTRVVKVFLPLFDVELSGGPSAVVPRTHRLPEKPQEVAKFLSKGSISGAEIAGAGTISQEAMPNHLAFAVKAGTACMMDIGIWHCAFPNTSPDARRQLIIGYQDEARRGGTGAIPSAADVRRYEDEGGDLPELVAELLGDDSHKATNTPRP